MSPVSIEIQLSTLPNSPGGVYQFYDAEDKILYVGKAKNLKKRVSSYFVKKHEYGKTRVLVKKIRKIKHIVVPTSLMPFCSRTTLSKSIGRGITFF